MSTATSSTARAASVIELDGSDLPAYCPNPSMALWNQHPRVFLDVTKGPAKCPYCGTTYELKAGAVVHGH